MRVHWLTRFTLGVATIFIASALCFPLQMEASANERGNTFGSCSPEDVQRLLPLINTIRRSRLLVELQTHPALTKAALSRAKQIAKTQRLSHDGWFQAISNNGYGDHAVAENIANGHKTSSAVTNGWFNSDGHRRNMLNPKYRFIGHGCVIDAEGRLWWAQLFGD